LPGFSRNCPEVEKEGKPATSASQMLEPAKLFQLGYRVSLIPYEHVIA
jgi:hypothetical protein